MPGIYSRIIFYKYCSRKKKNSLRNDERLDLSKQIFNKESIHKKLKKEQKLKLPSSTTTQMARLVQ